jgi:signal transduction histidine kinase
MQEVDTTIDTIISEHRELRNMIAALRTFLEAARPEIGAPGAHTWATDFAERLVKLHDKIFRHFRHEESCGVLEEIERANPAAAAALESLRRDHDRMLADLRALLGAAMVYGEAKPLEDVRLRRWALSILSHLEEHEHEETDLIQETFCRDLGFGG